MPVKDKMKTKELDREKQAYTKQLCVKCGNEVVMGFGFALMNLDKEVLCNSCENN